jgi:hypothetical protein
MQVGISGIGVSAGMASALWQAVAPYRRTHGQLHTTLADLPCQPLGQDDGPLGLLSVKQQHRWRVPFGSSVMTSTHSRTTSWARMPTFYYLALMVVSELERKLDGPTTIAEIMVSGGYRRNYRSTKKTILPVTR